MLTETTKSSWPNAVLGRSFLYCPQGPPNRTTEQILSNYPRLELEDVLACVANT